ncbi:hypothetical protein [Nonomuraea soli]|uniref:DUF3168 domain-containing protein n=1 Tax=Nonomuraea soli TaxID=1032476 RepID=A0A7W0CU43_9ACTN|nr:hypothetical protein [Nonomuraea soli]MBA2897392.1 hypothetical protein [Nonomuraea soli]
MTATNAVVIKRALLTLIEGLALGDVQVGYGPPANPERDFVYLGGLRGPLTPLTFRAGGRLPREEQLTLDLHLVVTRPGGTEEETETAAADLITPILEAVSAEPTLGATPGLLSIVPSRLELQSGRDDDACSTWLTLTWTIRSYVK